MVKKSGWHSVGLGTQSGRHSVGTALSRTALSWDGTRGDGTQSHRHFEAVIISNDTIGTYYVLLGLKTWGGLARLCIVLEANCDLVTL